MEKALIALPPLTVLWTAILAAADGTDTLREFGPLLNAGAVAVITGLFIYEHTRRGPAREAAFQQALEKLSASYAAAIEKLGREHKDAIEKQENEHKESLAMLLGSFREESRISREDRALDHAERREERKTMVEIMTQMREQVTTAMNHVSSVTGKRPPVSRG